AVDSGITDGAAQEPAGDEGRSLLARDESGSGGTSDLLQASVDEIEQPARLIEPYPRVRDAVAGEQQQVTAADRHRHVSQHRAAVPLEHDDRAVSDVPVQYQARHVRGDVAVALHELKERSATLGREVLAVPGRCLSWGFSDIDLCHADSSGQIRVGQLDSAQNRTGASTMRGEGETNVRARRAVEVAGDCGRRSRTDVGV